MAKHPPKAKGSPKTLANFTSDGRQWVPNQPGTSGWRTSSTPRRIVQFDQTALEELKKWMHDMHDWSRMVQEEINDLRARVGKLEK